MNTKFICLANSQKIGGRCVAGIEINGSNPVFIKNTPKWLRPISNSEHGEIPLNLVSHIKLLDIVEIDITTESPNGYQSENVLFDLKSIKVTGNFPLKNLLSLCDKSSSTIFGNKGKAVHENDIDSLNKSLMLIYTNKLKIYEKRYEDGKTQVRIDFAYNGNNYDLPITDSDFLEEYKTDNSFFDDDEAYLILSLAVTNNNWHSKLVAGII